MQTESDVKHEIAVLHPMHLGEILDRTFEMYRRNFALFAGIAAVPALLLLGIRTADLFWIHTSRLGRGADRGQVMVWGWLVAYAYYHISSFLAGLIFPAFVRSGSGILFGEKVSILASLRFVFVRWRSYLWVEILRIAAHLLIPEALAFGVMIGAAIILEISGQLDTSGFFPMGVVILIPLAGGIFLFFWVGAATALAIPVASLEGLSGLKALRRSWTLSRLSRWRIIITWFAVFVTSWILSGTVALLLQWLGYVLYQHHFHWFNWLVYNQAVYLFYAAIAAFLAPLFPLAAMLIYYDQRVRKEGYDLERMLEAAGLEAGNGGLMSAGLAATGEIQEPSLGTEENTGQAGLDEPESNQFARFIRNFRGLG
jgi:hypothetical protein